MLVYILQSILPVVKTKREDLIEICDTLKALKTDPVTNVQEQVVKFIECLKRDELLWREIDGDTLFMSLQIVFCLFSVRHADDQCLQM